MELNNACICLSPSLSVCDFVCVIDPQCSSLFSTSSSSFQFFLIILHVKPIQMFVCLSTCIALVCWLLTPTAKAAAAAVATILSTSHGKIVSEKKLHFFFSPYSTHIHAKREQTWDTHKFDTNIDVYLRPWVCAHVFVYACVLFSLSYQPLFSLFDWNNFDRLKEIVNSSRLIFSPRKTLSTFFLFFNFFYF